MKIAKKRLQRAVIEFKRRFADYPTRALDELLSVESVSRINGVSIAIPFPCAIQAAPYKPSILRVSSVCISRRPSAMM